MCGDCHYFEADFGHVSLCHDMLDLLHITFP